MSVERWFRTVWGAALLLVARLDLYAQELTPSSVSMGPGANRVWIAVGDLRREYLVYIPAGYDRQRPVPVLLMFHGSGGSLDEIANATGWRLKSEDQNFLAVFPNGFPNADGMRVWNDGRRSGDGRVDDVAFVRAMLDDLTSRLRVDLKRIHVVGFSNGAGLAYRLAAEMGDRIASIAPVAGRLSVSDPRLSRQVPAIAIVGTKDGGFQADVAAAERWAGLVGCQTTGDTTRSGRYAAVAYGGCPRNVRVVSYTIADWEHYWPGGRNPGVEMWGEKVIWDFFRKHPLR